MPSASVSPPIAAVAALDDILHRRVELGLDPDDLDVGLDRLGRDGDAAEISPPPPIGTTSMSRSGAASSISSAIVPAPGDHRGIVERMDEDQPALGLELLGMGMGVVEPLAVQHDGRAMALGLGDLHRSGSKPA